MRTLITAANRVLRSEVGARARRLASDDDEAFTLDAHGEILWQGGPVGRLTAGETMLAPRVEVRAGDFLEGEARERVRQRLQGFVRGEIERRLAPLFAAQALPLSGPARGIVFQLLGRARLRPDRGRRAGAEIARPGKPPGAGAAGRAVWNRDSLCRAAARPRSGPLPGAALGGMAQPNAAEIAGRTPTRQGDRDRSGHPALILCRDRAPGRCRTGAAAGPARTTGGGSPQPLADWAFCRRCGIGRIGRRRSRRAAPGFAGVRLSRGYRRGSRILCRQAAPTGARRAKARTHRRLPQRQSVCQTQGAEIRLIASDAAPERAKTRLDQWLWFARFVKSRSLAARLCAAGAVTINGSTVTKPNQAVRVGDIVIVPQGGWRRTVRVCGLGVRRGPASEARLLYEEAGRPAAPLSSPVRLDPAARFRRNRGHEVPAAFLKGQL